MTERDIEFVPGESFKTVEIFILNDNLSESVETFILILTSSPNSPNAVTVTPIQQAIVTIVDDDGETPCWCMHTYMSDSTLHALVKYSFCYQCSAMVDVLFSHG